jgi:hypothetical protein
MASRRPFVGRAKTKRNVEGHEFGSPIAAYEYETAGGEIRERQDRGFSIVRGYRRHRDVKDFAERLIAIFQPQLRSDLSWAQLKTKISKMRTAPGRRRRVVFEGGATAP